MSPKVDAKSAGKAVIPQVRQNGFNIEGGMADYTKTPGVNLCNVPGHVSLEQACILSDAVSISHLAVTKRVRVGPGNTVALMGWLVGLHALQMAKLGCRLDHYRGR